MNTTRTAVEKLCMVLNAKAREAGCSVTVGAVDSHNDDRAALAFSGGDARELDRAVRFAEAYYRKHIAKAAPWTHWADIGDAVQARELGWRLGRDVRRVVGLGQMGFFAT